MVDTSLHAFSIEHGSGCVRFSTPHDDITWGGGGGVLLPIPTAPELVHLRYIDTVFLGRQNHDNQIDAKFEKILFIIFNLVVYY